MKKKNLFLTIFFSLMLLLSAGFVVPKNSAYAVNRTYTYIVSTADSKFNVSKRDNSTLSQTSIATDVETIELALDTIKHNATAGKETLVYFDNLTLTQNLSIPFAWSNISGVLNLSGFSIDHKPSEAETILTFESLTLNSTSTQSPILVGGESSLTFNISNVTINTPNDVRYSIYVTNPNALLSIDNKIKHTTTFFFNYYPNANITLARTLDMSEQASGKLALEVPYTADNTMLINNCLASSTLIELVPTADFYTTKIKIKNSGMLYVTTQIKTSFDSNGGTLDESYTTTSLDYNSTTEIAFPSESNLTLAHNTLNGFLGVIELDSKTYYFDKNAIVAFASTGYDETQIDDFFFEEIDEAETYSYFTYYKHNPEETDPSFLAIKYFISKNKTASFVANWTKTIYTVNFDSDGGTSVSQESGIYGTQIDLTQASKNPTKTGHTFKHWVDENLTIYSNTISLEKNLNLTAVWETNKYLLTIKLDNGSEDIQVLVPYNTSFADIPEITTKYTKEGFTFVENNWVSADIPEVIYTNNSTMPDHAVIITAQWQKNTYLLTLYYNNSFDTRVFSTGRYYYGHDISNVLAQCPEVEGFTFVGTWFEDENGRTATTHTTMPAKDLKLYAYWLPKFYTLTFYKNGIVLSQQDNLRRGNVLNSYIPENPIIDGFVFDGWFFDSEFSVSFETDIEQKMPASNLNIYAKFIEKQTVTINAPKQTYEKSEFISFYLTTNAFGCKIEYLVDDKWTTNAPTDAGIYDIRISREEDSSYKAFSQIIEDGLTITPNTLNLSSIYIILYAVFIVEFFTTLFVLVLRKRKQSLTPLSVVLPFGIIPTDQFIHLIIAGVLAIVGFVLLVIELVKIHRVNLYEDTRSDEEKQEELNARIKDVSTNETVSKNVDELLKKEGFIDEE